MKPAIRVSPLAIAVVGFLFAGALGAQTVTVSGSCPGSITFDVAGAEPNGSVAMLTGDAAGSDVVPVGSCAGAELDVTGNLSLRTVVTADGSGQVSRTVTLPEPVCGSWFQALDVSSCGATNAAFIPVAEPTAIELDCSPTANPLRFRCAVTVEPAQPVEVSYSRTDGLGIERANRSVETAGDHVVPVRFLAPQREYSVTARALGHPAGPSDTVTFSTGTPPIDIDSWFDAQGVSTMGLVGGELPCDGDAVAVIYDTDTGDLVWYEDIDPNGSLGVLDMVRFTDEQTVLGETGNSVVEVDLDGAVLVDFDVSYPGCCNLHHDIEKANGLYYGFYQDTVAGLTLDAVVAFDPEGNELFEWNPRDHLPVPPGSFGDWLHTNSIDVQDDGTALLSWLTRDSVAKVDLDPNSPTFNEVLWIIDGNPPDALPEDITIDWSLVSGPDRFSDEHNFHRRNDGRYQLLDNGNGRGLVFSVDEVNRTALAEGVYDTREPFCGPQGTSGDTQDGNVVVGCLTEFLREYDVAGGPPIWEGEIVCANGGGGFLGTSSARWYPLDGWSDAYLPTQ